MKRKAPQRNPSRLYRIVKPLAEISIRPNPATNRCVGPEFFVMSENHPNVLDLATNHSRKDFVSKQIDVVMLNGQRFFVHVNASTITAGDILDNVLRIIFVWALYIFLTKDDLFEIYNGDKTRKIVMI